MASPVARPDGTPLEWILRAANALILLNSIVAVQECDATGAEQCFDAWRKKIYHIVRDYGEHNKSEVGDFGQQNNSQ